MKLILQKVRWDSSFMTKKELSDYFLCKAYSQVGDKLDDQWVHRALVRSGSTWYSFQNGTLYWTADLGSSALNTASQYHWLGRGYNSTSNRTNEGPRALEPSQ